MNPLSISAVNRLSEEEKWEIFRKFIPDEVFSLLDLPADLRDPSGVSLLKIRANPGSTDAVIQLYHQLDAEDPLLYAHITDTQNGQIHVLLYIVNDPNSPRYDVDRLPDGTKTEFGLFKRNIPAEIAAFEAGLAPGQIRKGLRLLNHSIDAFEDFVEYLHHEIFFVEPLYYHNAIIFERYGFAYQQGRRFMDLINAGFLEDGELLPLLDGSTPFRRPEVCCSIRGRSWAIHDGILGEPFSDVTMFKQIREHAGLSSFPDGIW